MDNSDKVPASARDGLIDFGGYDSETYHALSARLKDRLSSTAWSARYSPEECDKKFTGNGV
jgi:hypothetical protein